MQTASFDDHWNHPSAPYEEWLDCMAALAGHDPDGWWLLACVDGTPAAVCLLDESRAESGDGYVRSLSVSRASSAAAASPQLLLTPARSSATATWAGAGARPRRRQRRARRVPNHLYESVGMRPYRVIDAWQIPID